MSSLVPQPFLFRYVLPVRHNAGIPGKKRLLPLDPSDRLPWLGELSGKKPFADLSLAWNPQGLGVVLEVRGKSQALQCDSRVPEESDGLQLWFDLRNTQSIHRASKFCQHFCILPTGGGPDGDEPVVTQLAIARAREDAPMARPSLVKARSETLRNGYRLEVWFAAEALNGFDPESYPRLGFYSLVVDRELGMQPLTVDREFPFAHDPSLWSTLELQSA